jgi:hypothetical protein
MISDAEDEEASTKVKTKVKSLSQYLRLFAKSFSFYYFLGRNIKVRGENLLI